MTLCGMSGNRAQAAEHLGANCMMIMEMTGYQQNMGVRTKWLRKRKLICAVIGIKAIESLDDTHWSLQWTPCLG